MKLCAEKPCPTCPWRKSSKVGGADIPHFDMDKMRNLTNTVPPRGTDKDGFYPVMACHNSPEGKEYACAGYIARHGYNNIEVRFMQANGHLDLLQVIENCKGIDLYDTFYQILDDYEAAQCDNIKADTKNSFE